jgi:hypothetical protein
VFAGHARDEGCGVFCAFFVRRFNMQLDMALHLGQSRKRGSGTNRRSTSCRREKNHLGSRSLRADSALRNVIKNDNESAKLLYKRGRRHTAIKVKKLLTCFVQ